MIQTGFSITDGTPGLPVNPVAIVCSSRKGSQRGFSLWVTACVAAAMIGCLGLAIDLGHMFIVKNELQAYVDSAALAACRLMDGTQTGVQLADAMAKRGPMADTKPNAWDFDVNVVSNVDTAYSPSYGGPYVNYSTAAASPSNTYRFIRITASASLPLYFLRIIPGIPSGQNIRAAATAGQKSSGGITSGGLTPFAPDAHDTTDSRNFGLVPGQRYTLKWDNGNTTSCQGDAGFNPVNAPDQHGYIDIGQGNGTANLDKAIIYGGFPNGFSTPSSINVGSTVNIVPGDRAAVGQAVYDRSAQDPDQTSLTWDQYKASSSANWRRVILTGIGDPDSFGGVGTNRTVEVTGFGSFLLDPAAMYGVSSGALCATYIGPGDASGGGSGGTSGQVVYSITLFN